MATRERVEDGKNVSVFLPREVIARLDRIAEKVDQPRNKVLRNFIDVWSEAIEQSDKMGLWSMSVLLTDFKDSCAQWVESLELDDPANIGKFRQWENREWAKAKS